MQKRDCRCSPMQAQRGDDGSCPHFLSSFSRKHSAQNSNYPHGSLHRRQQPCILTSGYIILLLDFLLSSSFTSLITPFIHHPISILIQHPYPLPSSSARQQASPVNSADDAVHSLRCYRLYC